MSDLPIMTLSQASTAIRMRYSINITYEHLRYLCRIGKIHWFKAGTIIFVYKNHLHLIFKAAMSKDNKHPCGRRRKHLSSITKPYESLLKK